MTRGEVWWVEEPDNGRRPFLVLTRDSAVPVLTRVMAVPTTRTVRGIPTEVRLDAQDGMPDECVLSLDNVSAVWRGLFRERICTLTPQRMHEVCRALALATGCA